MDPLTILRRTLVAFWLALAVPTLAVVALSHVGPALGLRVIIVNGDSMSPAIPIGSLLVERRPAGTPAVGDVVTMEMPNGATITHRVSGVFERDGQVWLETRGDANAAADPAPVPAAIVSGVVDFHLPLAGYLLAVLGLPTGAVCTLATLAALLFAIWLLEDRVRSAVARSPQTGIADAPAS